MVKKTNKKAQIERINKHLAAIYMHMLCDADKTLTHA
jgi:hypothetical protein